MFRIYCFLFFFVWGGFRVVGFVVVTVMATGKNASLDHRRFAAGCCLFLLIGLYEGVGC